MGYLLSPVFVLTRHATHVTAALTYPVFILSGLMIPSNLLPVPMTWLSRPISLFWANRFFTTLAQGSPDAMALVAVAALTAGYFWIGSALLDRLIDRARRAGTIDVG
jgi:ABC-2 type transport system permease protein